MNQQLQTGTKRKLFWMAVTIGFAACGSASAQTVGRTTSVKPGVFRNSAPAGVGAPVAQNDLMNTDVQGRTNLQFLDQSTLDIGPGSDVRIDRFVYSPNRTTAGATISLAKGVLRYDSRGGPGTVQVRTPTSTLGIRG
jgi:hypothetical protein